MSYPPHGHTPGEPHFCEKAGARMLGEQFRATLDTQALQKAQEAIHQLIKEPVGTLKEGDRLNLSKVSAPLREALTSSPNESTIPYEEAVQNLAEEYTLRAMEHTYYQNAPGLIPVIHAVYETCIQPTLPDAAPADKLIRR